MEADSTLHPRVPPIPLGLYETPVGRQLFGGGDTVTYTLAAVVTLEPDWSALPANTPQHIRRMLERCLRKGSKAALRDIGDVRIILDAGEDEPAVVTAASSVNPQRAWLARAAAGVLAVAFSAASFIAWHGARPTPPRPLMRLSVEVGWDADMVRVRQNGALALYRLLLVRIPIVFLLDIR